VEYGVDSEPAHGNVAVRVVVRLTPRELTKLFVAGDLLVHLPADGLLESAPEGPMPRTSMFLSELAERRDGYLRSFRDRAAAEAYTAVLREQLDALAARMRTT